MPISIDDHRIVYMPQTDVMEASGTCEAIRNGWWCVHPEHGLIFWQDNSRRAGKLLGAKPQCNKSEYVARMVQERLYPWAELHQIPLVMAPIDVGDYA